MKKNMKKKYIFLTISTLLALAICLCACNQAKDFAAYSDNMNKSMNDVKTLVSTLSVFDGDTLVYEYQRNVTIDGSNATLEITEKKLNANFRLESNTTTEQKSGVEKSTLLPLSLSESSAQNFNANANGFSCEIPEGDFASVFKLGSYDIDGNAALDCAFSGDKLTNINCGFKLKDGKTVKLAYVYNY